MRYLVRGRRGHRRAQELWLASDQIVTASITYVETRAALAAGSRGRYWTAAELVRLQRAWEDAWRDFVVVEVDPLVTLAAGLTDQDPLSGCDAVQLAAALASACDVLVAADRRLCAAARHQELKVIDLEDEEVGAGA
jgi:predicted nucleic acid-binding protein